jgi:hypothetical protein
VSGLYANPKFWFVEALTGRYIFIRNSQLPAAAVVLYFMMAVPEALGGVKL